MLDCGKDLLIISTENGVSHVKEDWMSPQKTTARLFGAVNNGQIKRARDALDEGADVNAKRGASVRGRATGERPAVPCHGVCTGADLGQTPAAADAAQPA